MGGIFVLPFQKCSLNKTSVTPFVGSLFRVVKKGLERTQAKFIQTMIDQYSKLHF